MLKSKALGLYLCLKNPEFSKTSNLVMYNKIKLVLLYVIYR